jgi:hypothetical protein
VVRPVRPVLADDRARPVGVRVALLGVRVGGVLLRVDRRFVPPDEPVRRERQPQLVHGSSSPSARSKSSWAGPGSG